MASTVKDIIKINSLSKAKIITATKGLNNPVENIMIIEAPDVERWISNNEILLSSLYGFDKLSVNEIKQFMLSLHKHKCSGLIIKISRFIEKIPDIIVTYCSRYKIPLIEIPQEVKYKDIMLETMQLLFNEKNLLLNQYKKTSQQFINLAIQNGSLKAIIDLLSSLVHNPTFIFKIVNGKAVQITENNEAFNKIKNIDFNLQKPVALKKITNYQYYKETINNSEDELLMVKIPSNKYCIFIGILQKSKLQEKDYITIENAISYTQIEILKQNTLKQSLRTYSNDIIDDLINGKITSQDEFQATLKHFNLNPAIYYRIVVIQALKKGKVQLDYFRDNPQAADQIVKQFKIQCPDAVYRIHKNRIIFIISDKQKAIEILKQKFTNIIKNLDFFYSKLNFQIGISDACYPASFKYYTMQSLKILQIINQLNGNNSESSQILSYTDLGFYRLLFQVDNQEKLQSFVPEVLIKMYHTSPDLYLTLKTYLKNNQNAKASARELYIHPKTMSYRLKKIEEQSKIDFSDSEQLFHLNVGIRVLNILNNNVQMKGKQSNENN